MIAEVRSKSIRKKRNIIILLCILFCIGFYLGSMHVNPVDVNYEEVTEDNDSSIEASAPIVEESSEPQITEENKEFLVLVNKENDLDSDYIPEDLRKLDIPFSFEGYNEQKQMRKEAADAVEELVKESKAQGLNIVGVSAFRSFDSQNNIYNHSVKMQGREHADKFSAKPGKSEHQTGLVIDVSTPSIKNDLIEKFESTKEGIWLRDNCHKYGFIIRYPKEKEYITGYAYEPWHIRYVGKKAAQEIHDENLTLEEYLKNKEQNR